MDYIGSQEERRKIASWLTEEIRLFNFLAKRTDNPSERRNFYRLKHRRLSWAITHFAEYFKLLSVEFNSSGTLLVLIQLADGRSGAHCPWEYLSEAAREDIRSLLSARLTTTNSSARVQVAA